MAIVEPPEASVIISTPLSGRIRVDSRIVPLIKGGAGFIPELAGRKNALSILMMSMRAPIAIEA
ncbi:hypothetical protein [Thiocystis violascens]|uniref:hypothetical protein n=1 Tax=Thiocystis violascens TaxID=73141 RepID=UPI00022C16ED|nr:hypothetical protein [Thiocystis violascens]